MTIGAGVARRDRGLVGASFLVGGIAFPWLPGPYLPEASLATVVALAFLLPTTALAACVGQAVLGVRADGVRTDDEPSRASAGVIATATTALCSFALSLHVLVLTTLVDAPIRLPAPARAAMVLLGLHLVVVGNAIPRLRPAAQLGAVQMTDSRRHAWMRAYRTAGYLCVGIGVTVAIAGASLGGTQIDSVLKIALLSASVCVSWSLRRVWTA